ncbi:unnamed protein product [Didymodactylos carnosus]|uniref:Uncharacterized protein n=1 Tax=Didymodactylos carnosus TaxID=1234261 RepID=A0A815BNB8_9BILA|nr:unnamed protein product [Didymodactylos carnosus]CAF1297887.1 unnamed protein product [Didymodactylos carnosus]CAF4062445.1 unnamed protein product [Didymodactylos carnosus]CAF4103380.1 unnamed protein product [Didymodactylos carnosus]
MHETISLDILYANERVPDELYTLVQNGLSSQLDVRLSELSNPIEYLTALSWHGQQRLSLLMVAALNGFNEIVRVLFAHCDPKQQVELKGRMVISDEEHIDGATALYCACYRTHFTVAQTLLELGHANVNQSTHKDSTYPLLIHASMRNRLDIVHFLVENGYSDVNETKSDDRDKCTALIWAAFRGHSMLVKYLIEKGADMNYSCDNTDLIAPTPLTCATLRGHAESVRVLYDAGANTNVKDKYGNTLLKMAAKNKAVSVINLFLERSINTVEDLELVACSFINISSSMVQMHGGLELLRVAIQHRESMDIPKVCIPSVVAYDFEQECQTVDELDSIKDNRDRMLIEMLLVRERILLPPKDETLMRPLLDYGDVLVNRGEFDKCLYLWVHAFYLYQQMELDTILHRFVWLFCKMMTANQTIPAKRFVQVCRLTFEPSQNKYNDDNIGNELCLVVLAAEILEQQGITREEQSSICCWINDLCRQRRRTLDGQTLLHLCVNEQTNKRLEWRRRDTISFLKFPNASGLRLLLACGYRWLDLDVVEWLDGNTPLHLICCGSEDQEIIELLVNARVHIDCVNAYRKTPVDYVENEMTRAFLMSKLTPPHLKCLCARVIANKRLDTSILGPPSSVINAFISLHGGLLRETDND